MGEVIAKVVKR